MNNIYFTLEHLKGNSATLYISTTEHDKGPEYCHMTYNPTTLGGFNSYSDEQKVLEMMRQCVLDAITQLHPNTHHIHYKFTEQ